MLYILFGSVLKAVMPVLMLPFEFFSKPYPTISRVTSTMFVASSLKPSLIDSEARHSNE